MLKRKMVMFDIDTKLAKKIFGNGFTSIYDYIERYFEKNYFMHIEGSGYMSIDPVTDAEASVVVAQMADQKPGLEKCIRDIRMADIEDEYDLNCFFDYDGTIGKYPDKTAIRRNRSDRER